MTVAFKAILFLHILVLFCQISNGQTKKDTYDLALDRYEEICDRCLLLRASAAQGKSVPQEELTRLLQQLGSLRKTLSDASGNMSNLQQERFDRIKSKYSQSVLHKRVSREEQPIPRIPAALPPASAEREAMDGHLPPLGRQSPTTGRSRLDGHTPRNLIMIQVGAIPDLSYGLMIGRSGKTFGGYAAFRTNGMFQQTLYDCKSDGSTEFGYIWTTGAEHVNRWNCAAGLLVRISGSLLAYGGAGYGLRTLAWEDDLGAWAKVADRSFKGLAAECGLAYSFDRLTISAGCSTVRFGYTDLVFGLGWRF